MKESKLSLNKYTIAKLNNLKGIVGGGGETTNPSDICFITVPNTTITCNTIESEVMGSGIICLNYSSVPCEKIQQQ